MEPVKKNKNRKRNRNGRVASKESDSKEIPIIDSTEKRLLNGLRKPSSKKEIARILKTDQDDPKFILMFDNLLMTGKIVLLKNQKYGLSSQMNMVSGIIDANAKGFGFLLRDDGKDDIFIPMHLMDTAFDKDRVVVKVIKSGRGDKLEGKVVSILERRTQKITGTLNKKGKFYYVVPDDKKILKNIFIDNQVIDEAFVGEKVIVKLSEWDNPNMNPTGILLDVIKYKNKIDLMGTMLLLENGFDTEFPLNVENEVEKINFDFKSDLASRVDLRDKLIFTIDPADAKDFDDAVSIEFDKDITKIGVHIADVSYFVKEGSATDIEAYKRGTSVYLIDKTVPMLPERLSNDLCSLKPDIERYTVTCDFTIDKNGRVGDYAIYPSVIKSKRRFNYKEAEEVIEHGVDDQFKRALKKMLEVSERISKYAFSIGRIDFDMPEVEVILSENNEPVLIREKVRLKTHKLIELFMVSANSIVSEYLSKRTKRTIYRVHEEPNMEKLEALNLTLKNYNFTLKSLTSQSLQQVIKKSENTDAGFLIREMVLRAMMRAKYTIDNHGHFGLGLEYYTHFTSPIRRYPDLAIHRQLKDVMSGKKNSYNDFELVAKHASEREFAATRAERDSIDIAKMYYITNNMQKEYFGVISSVTAFGIFIQIKDVFIEGLVRYREMDDDFYQLNDNEVSVTGLHTNNVITLGDTVIVKIMNIVPEKMTLDLKIIKFLKKYQ